MDLQVALKWFELRNVDELDLISLKKKYRKLTLKYHPDKGGETTDFVQLQAAYNYLQECIKYPHSHKFNSQEHRNSNCSNNSTDIEFYKQQINNLKKSNFNYQNLINSQITTIKQFYNNLDQINSQSNKYNVNLGKLLDDEIAKLDKKYQSGWWKGLIGMQSMNKNDLIFYQNHLINEHNELLAKSQQKNLQENYNAYQKVLNDIVQGINRNL
jgi:DnaJ domain